MKRITAIIIFTLFALIPVQESFAQSTDVTTVPNNYKTYKVAIFAPLYLDSAFVNGEYKYVKKFPKMSVHGLEFVQGAQIALDSMKVFNSNIEASFYDTKSSTQSIAFLTNSSVLDSVSLIIGAVKDEDFKALAALAQKKNIPFISAIYPNDDGIKSNPFLVIVNPTLKAHCEAIYAYLLQKQNNSNIIYCRQPGAQENLVASYFEQLNTPDGVPLFPIKTINITDDFSVLAKAIDSTRNNIIIGGSLHKPFVGKLVTAVAEINKTTAVTLIGMPNWDAFTEISKRKEFKDLPIYFTTAYYKNEANSFALMLQKIYIEQYNAAPSDMAYRGFETVYLFAKQITRYPNDFINHLNDYPYAIFNEYNFKPIFLRPTSTVPDYFENKKLYFIKMQNGLASKAW